MTVVMRGRESVYVVSQRCGLSISKLSSLHRLLFI